MIQYSGTIILTPSSKRSIQQNIPNNKIIKKIYNYYELEELLVEVPEQVKEQELTQFSPRNLQQFETIFMTEQQVKKGEDMFARKVKSSSPIFIASKVLKSVSLSI